MLPPKLIIRFAILVTFFYGLFTVARPYIERPYASWFRGFANAVYSRFWFWGEGQVRFFDLHSPRLFEEIDEATPGEMSPRVKAILPRPEGVKDTLMVLMNRAKPGPLGMLRTGSRIIAFEPTVVLISLALATPIAWRRKPFLLIVGLVFVHAFIAVRLAPMLANEFFTPAKKYALGQGRETVLNTIQRFDEVFGENPTASWAMPFFLYLFALFFTSLFWGRRTTGLPPDDDNVATPPQS